MPENTLSHGSAFFEDCEPKMMMSSPANIDQLVQLKRKAQVEVLDPCKQQGLDWVKPFGIYRTFPTPVTFQGPTHDWVLFPLQHEPLFLQGKFPMPDDVLNKLARLRASEIVFPYIYVAHELPKGYSHRAESMHPNEFIAPPHRETLEFSRKVGEWSEKLFNLTKSALRVGATMAASAPALLAFPLVDPVLFGAIPLYGQREVIEPAYYFELASWNW